MSASEFDIQTAAVTKSSPIRQGVLVGIQASGEFRFESDTESFSVAAADLIQWGARRDWQSGAIVYLIDGSELVGDILEVTADTVLVGDATGTYSYLWDQITVPRKLIRSVSLQPSAVAAKRDAIASSIWLDDAKSDSIQLLNGDEIRGRVIELAMANSNQSQMTLVAESDFGSLEIDERKVRAIGLAGRRLPKSERTQGVRFVGLLDGTLLAAKQVQVAEDQCTLQLVCGLKISADRSWFFKEVCLLRQVLDSVDYISDLDQIDYRHIPLLGLSWPLAKDTSVLGSRLRSGGFVFSKGLGMHSSSRVVYRLPKGAKYLQGAVALDASAGQGGSIHFRVYGDRGEGIKPLYESRLRGGMEPSPLRVDVQNVRTLVLLVGSADQANVLDRANWLNLCLIR